MECCSFSGHRYIPKHHQRSLENLTDRAIAYAYSEGCRRFCAGGALGFDTLAAKAVISFRLTHRDVSLVLVLPCKNQDLKWSDRQKNMYEYFLSVADEIIYVSDEYSDDCMKKRNFSLAEMCDMLVVYSHKQYSGSAQTARFAREMGKPVYNLYNEAQAMAGG